MQNDDPCPSVSDFYEEVIGSDPEVLCASPSSALQGLHVLAYDTAHLGVPWTVATCGMSAKRMNVSPEAAGCAARAELICYLPAISHEYTWWLRWLAEFPFIDETWIGHGHTVSSEHPLFPESELRHFLLLPSLVRTHREMSSRVRIEGDEVELWWVVPITDAERDYKRRHGRRVA